MKNKEFKELLKKSFGKEKDERFHAGAMAIIYLSIFLLLMVFIRFNTPNISNKANDNLNNKPKDIKEVKKDKEPANIKDNDLELDNDVVNYSYSYVVTYDNMIETYLGKKYNNKESFIYIKDNSSSEYAIIDDIFLTKKEDNKYHITNYLNNYFKYLDMNKLLSITDSSIEIDNQSLSNLFNDRLVNDNHLLNSISMSINDVVTTCNLDFTNYISSVLGENHSFIVKMEFSNIGKVNDFNIEIS